MILLLASYICMLAQAQTYYYYNNEKIYIDIDTSLCTIFIDTTSTTSLQSNNVLINTEDESRNDYYIVNKQVLFDNLTSSDNSIIAIEPVVGDSQVPVSNLFYIELKDEADSTLLQNLANTYKCTIERRIPNMPKWFALSTSLESLGNSIELSNAFYETGHFNNVDPGFIIGFATSASSGEPMYGEQWGLQAINIEEAWDITKGISNVIVAVVDQGIDSTHIEFSNNLLSGFDTRTKGNAKLYDAHGTHVAGIIAANQNNQFISGVAPFSTLMPISSPLKAYKTISEELAIGISWAWQHNAYIINNSWGGSRRNVA